MDPTVISELLFNARNAVKLRLEGDVANAQHCERAVEEDAGIILHDACEFYRLSPEGPSDALAFDVLDAANVVESDGITDSGASPTDGGDQAVYAARAVRYALGVLDGTEDPDNEDY